MDRMDPFVDINSEPPPAMVLQCRQCLQILGDTAEFVCSVKSRNYLVLRAGCGITISPEEKAGTLSTSWHTSEDRNSSFCLVTCGRPACPGNIVGRVYTRVPDVWALIRNCICFDTRAIISHQLGQANVRFGDRTFLVPAPARSLRSRTVLDGPNQRELPAIQSAAQQELADRVEILEAELLKVQNVLLAHHQAIQAATAATRTRAQAAKRSKHA